MRTRDRLISVCQSLNPATVGEANVQAMVMATRLIDRHRHVCGGHIRDELMLIRKKHPSPHVRELAAELLALK